MEERYSNPDNDPRGPWSSSDLSVKTYSKEYDYPIKTPSGKIIKPTKGRCWRTSKENLQKLIKDKRIWFGSNRSGVPRIKRFLSEVQAGLVPGTIWMHSEVGHNQEARQVIKEIFPDVEFPFETPKPVRLIKRILQIATSKKDFILDSFAGSGTTGHAVLDLNKEDGGNRKFILVEMEKNIAKNITAERVKRVSRGYSYKTGKGKVVKIPGLGGGFEYVELGEPLFNENGMINEKVSYSDMARYIFFTETHTNLENRNIKENYLGKHGDYHYFLLFDGIKNNVLNRKFLKEIKKKDGKKIVYADKCLLDEDVLDKYQIVFKQIPYQVKVY